MNGARIAFALVLLVTPVFLSRFVVDSDRPRDWSLGLAGLLVSGFVLFETSLIHSGLPVIFEAVGATSMAEACRRLGGHLFGASPAYGGAALVVAGVIAIGSVRGVLAKAKISRTLITARSIGSSSRFEGFDVISLPIQKPVAMAVPDPSGPFVVVSQPATSCLDESELSVVLSHEASHLRHHHARFLILAAAIRGGLGFVPGVRRSVAALIAGLERWADADAADGSPDRWQAIQTADDKLAGSGSHHYELRWRAGSAMPTGSDPLGVWGWKTVVSGAMPLALALMGTLAVHLNEVIKAASG